MIAATSGAFGILYWTAVLVLTAITLGLAILAYALKRNGLIVAAAASLALGLLIVAIPTAPPVLGVSIPLGILALGAAIVGGGPAASYVLRLATRGSVPPGLHGGILVSASSASSASSDTTASLAHHHRHEVLRGGMMIGLLERLAIAASLMAGFPEAIAVIVAIKGVGRFTELAEPESRERFIIGTFASMIWACAGAGLFLLAVTP